MFAQLLWPLIVPHKSDGMEGYFFITSFCDDFYENFFVVKLLKINTSWIKKIHDDFFMIAILLFGKGVHVEEDIINLYSLSDLWQII